MSLNFVRTDRVIICVEDGLLRCQICSSWEHSANFCESCHTTNPKTLPLVVLSMNHFMLCDRLNDAQGIMHPNQSSVLGG